MKIRNWNNTIFKHINYKTDIFTFFKQFKINSEFFIQKYFVKNSLFVVINPMSIKKKNIIRSSTLSQDVSWWVNFCETL